MPAKLRYSQDEDAEPNTSCARASYDSHKIHDQDSSKETSLKTVHSEKSPGPQGVAHEEDDGKNIDEETYNDEQHEDHDAPTCS